MRYRTRLMFAAAAMALASSTPAVAQEVDEGTICVSVARLWFGTLEETAAIKSVPVPESYLRLFRGDGPCGSNLIVSTLIDWHLAFGDERSTAAALAFLEKEKLHRAEPLADLDRQVRQAGKAARRDVMKAAPLLAKPEERAKGWRMLGKSQWLTQLRDMERSWRDHLFMAQSHMRAAAAFQSPEFLARAKTWYEPTQRAATAFQEVRSGYDPEAQDVLPDVLSDNHGKVSLAALEGGIAVYTAVLSRTPANIGAAEATLKRNSRPIYDAALRQAYGAGDDFCDFDEDGPSPTSSEECRQQEDDFEYEVLAWAPLRATLDVLEAERAPKFDNREPLDATDSVDNAVRLLAASENNHGWPSEGLSLGSSKAGESAAQLYLVRASAYERLARSVPGDTFDQRSRRDNLILGAFNDLARAEAASPPEFSPTRFRRIAREFIRLDAFADSLPSENGDAPRSDDMRVKRKVAYFRTVLPRLDDIAAGR